MANQVAKRDSNRVTVLLATGNDSDGEVLRLIVDPTTKRLLVDSLTEIEGYGEVGTGTQTVASAGTRVQLSAVSVTCKRVFIQALETNTGTIVVGGSSVVAASATRQGIALYATQGQWFNVNNLNLLYIDSTVNGEKVHYYYEV